MARASSALPDVPLFPLPTVLYPGGELDLRVFEPRYLSLVRECTRHDRCFGICLILSGHEAGEPASPAAVGTLARIRDFSASAHGLLEIRVVGEQRFRVQQVRVRDDGQVRGRLDCWPDEPAVPIPAQFGLLETIWRRMGEAPGAPENARGESRDDASWLGFRLAETLPLDPLELQLVLEMSDPLDRLAWLQDVLPRFQRE